MIVTELTQVPASAQANVGLGDADSTTMSGGLVEWIQARPKVLEQLSSAISIGRTAHDVGEAVRHELLGLYCDEMDIPDLRGVDWVQVGSRFPLTSLSESSQP
jgi:hypothetical protein